MQYKIRLVAFLFFVISFNNVHSQTNYDSVFVAQSIASIRNTAISFLKKNDTEQLKAYLTDSILNIRYPKNMLFTYSEKAAIHIIKSDFSAAAASHFLSIANRKYFPHRFDFAGGCYDSTWRDDFQKSWPPTDSLPQLLSASFVMNQHKIIGNIYDSDSLSKAKKVVLLINVDYYLLNASSNKKPFVKKIYRSLKQYDEQYKDTTRCSNLFSIRRDIAWYRRSVFWGFGIGTGQFTNGGSKIVSNPLTFHADFDWYKNRIGGYGFYNLAGGIGLKTKVDTSINNKPWPAKTKNFLYDLQVGVGVIAIKTDYARLIVKSGFGFFRMASKGSNKVKLKRFPYYGIGGCLDIADFKNRFTNKPYKTPIGIRLYYHCDFLSFKKKYPEFPANFQSYGIQFGLML